MWSSLKIYTENVSKDNRHPPRDRAEVEDWGHFKLLFACKILLYSIFKSKTYTNRVPRRSQD